MFHSAKSVDAAFQGVSQKIGTEIWRIQNLEPVPLPKSDYGKFYSGDSYIVLHISLGKGTVNSYDIHYWIGIDTTQEEAEISALKTIELDISLGSRSVQHREPQGFESDKFLSYFRPCIIPLEGGVASGFKKIEEGKFETKLYNCKGNRIARLKQVSFVRSSLNHDDVFILDTVDKIYQFNGANSNIQERAKALEVVQHLKNEYHGGKCTISIVDDGKHAAESDSGDFWVCFGGFAPIGRKASSEDDLAKEIIPGRLYSIADGLLNMEDGTLSKSKLEKKKCYLLDCGAEVFVWVGRATQVDARKSTCKAVQDFINSQSRPISMRITQVIQGYETQSFKSNFESWPLHTETSTEEGRGKVSAFLKKHGVDVKGAAKGSSINDDTSALFQGGGKIEVWYINDDAKIVVSKEDIGKFFSGDCYIVLYTHTSGDKKDEYFLSVWMGKDSTEEDRTMASRLSNKMYNFFKGKAVQGWIFQGKEPPQFIGIFQPMVLLMGGMSSGYKKFIAEKKLNDDTYVKENIAMFQVFNSSMHKNKVDQVIAAATSLCSSDCFVLQSGSTCFIWHGNSSTFEQQEWALKVAEFLKPGSTLKILKEGAETSAFWFILGGKQSYSNKRVAQENVKDPHLYTFLLNNGKLEVSEVFNFSQDDLLPEDILILDTHVEVFLWVGHLVPPKEKENAFDIGQKYIKHVMALDGLSSDVPLYKITEGNEPFFFTGYFSWDSAKAAIPGNSFTKKFSLLFGSTLSGSELSVKSNQSHRSGQTQWASAMDALSSALNSTTQFESSEKSQELNQSGPTQRAAALEALTYAFNPTSIQPESRKSHERSHSGSSQRAAALEALTSAFNPISAQPELCEKSQEPNHSGPTQRAAALEALTSAFNPTSTHSEVLSLYKHLQTLQDSGSTQRAAALEALTSAFNPTKAQSESSEKSQKPIHSSSSQKAAALEALTAAFNPTPAQSESSERSHETDHSKPTQRASAMELLSSAFNPTSTKSEPPERSYEPNHSGPTQRASAWESLSSAFNSVSTKPSLPKPRLSSQGSQMAAAIAALSSVLTSETPARLSRSSSPVSDVVEHNAVPVECNADVVQHNVLTTDVDHSRHEAMDVDHCRPGTESNANTVEVSKIEDNRISEQMSENSHNKPELDNERFEEEEQEGASTFSYERLKATSNNPVVGIDYKRREAYLSSMEFESVFKMTKEEFYKQPKWKQDGQKRKLELF